MEASTNSTIDWGFFFETGVEQQPHLTDNLWIERWHYSLNYTGILKKRTLRTPNSLKTTTFYHSAVKNSWLARQFNEICDEEFTIFINIVFVRKHHILTLLSEQYTGSKCIILYLCFDSDYLQGNSSW